MSDLAFVYYRHTAAGFELPVPSRWERMEDSRPGVPLIAVESEHGRGFRSNLVVTVERLPEGHDLGQWQTAAEKLLPRQLRNYTVLDTEYVEIAGRPAMRRLAHHTQAKSGPVTMGGRRRRRLRPHPHRVGRGVGVRGARRRLGHHRHRPRDRSGRFRGPS